MTQANPLELFDCEPYACRLTRKACLSRQEQRTAIEAGDNAASSSPSGMRAKAPCFKCTPDCTAGAETRRLAEAWGDQVGELEVEVDLETDLVDEPEPEPEPELEEKETDMTDTIADTTWPTCLLEDCDQAVAKIVRASRHGQVGDPKLMCADHDTTALMTKARKQEARRTGVCGISGCDQAVKVGQRGPMTRCADHVRRKGGAPAPPSRPSSPSAAPRPVPAPDVAPEPATAPAGRSGPATGGSGPELVELLARARPGDVDIGRLPAWLVADVVRWWRDLTEGRSNR